MSFGLLDTSVIIDWDSREVADALPDESAISSITLAELSAGPRLASTGAESARRQSRLQQVEAIFNPIPFDVNAARSYGEVVTAVTDTGRTHRPRIADLFIAATAHANGLTLYTRNPLDFIGLEDVIDIVSI
jgi:predicted nucleic acid-binding protein